ncbi:choice-of-anchor A family protein [Vibrio sp. 1-Bac 57]
MKKTYTIIALVAGLYSQVGVAGPIELLNEYNLIVFGDLQSNSEVEGKTLVGGNISGSASNYGINLAPAVNALVVGGNVTSGTTINANGHTVTVAGNNNGTINSALTVTGSSPVDFGLVKNELTAFSSYLANLNANSLLDSPNGNQPSAANFNVDSSVGNGMAVFNIDTSDLFGNGLVQQYDIKFANQSPSAVVINVAGENITDASLGNPVGGFNKANSDFIIWNFYEAIDIKLDKRLQGSLLAPLATLTISNYIEGSVVVDNFYQNGEIHNPVFNGDIAYNPIPTVSVPTPVPTPSSLLIFAAALLGLGLWRRKTSIDK